MILTLLVLPVLAAVAAFLLRRDTPRRILLVFTAAAHAAVTGATWVARRSSG